MISQVDSYIIFLKKNRFYFINMWIENDRLWKLELAIDFIITIFKINSIINLRKYLHLRCNKINMIFKLQGKNKTIIRS